jgi:uncharacterized low-complexity protein
MYIYIHIHIYTSYVSTYTYIRTHVHTHTHTHTHPYICSYRLRTGIPAVQQQLGMTGLVEATVTLINQSPNSPWATTQHVSEALHCLANLTDASEENRHRAVASACVRQVITHTHTHTSTSTHTHTHTHTHTTNAHTGDDICGELKCEASGRQREPSAPEPSPGS